MKRGADEINTDGKRKSPWFYENDVNQNDNMKEGPNKHKPSYQYLIRSRGDKDYIIWERGPKRILDIGDPEFDKGFNIHASQVRSNQNKLFIVNGHLEIRDEYFVGGLYFSEIPDEKICVGPFIQIEDDIELLAKHKINAVLCVEDSNQYMEREVKQHQHILHFCVTKGIKTEKKLLTPTIEGNLGT